MLAARLIAWAAAGEAAALVEVTGVAGSAPREVGAQMAVSAQEIAGTIGGGALEAAAIHAARRMLAAGDDTLTLDQPLGPEIGQCCGGRVRLSIRRTDPDLIATIAKAEEEAAQRRPTVLIFGAGHTGAALARALAPLPLNVTVVDQRSEWLADIAPPAKRVETALPEAEVAAAPPGAAYIILTHDHSLDFLVAEAALSRGDAAYVGMIGSQTKRAKLVAELTRKGVFHDNLICPIGAAGPSDKRPEVIAAMTAAEVAAKLL
ncbi:MAG: xanthine dehydrogenase accessory protein XdhC [Rhodobacteraceae bacterium]|nr:xanthine dehydrogenase accessory protein XdhC [Paracoccaceae bacterium]